MENFEQITSIWKTQKSDFEIDPKQLQNRIKKEQGKMIFVNLFLSLSFAVAFAVLAYIWSSFPDRSWYFYGSLTMMGLVMLGFLAGMWTGLSYQKAGFLSDPRYFLQSSIKTIKTRIWMLQYGTPLYLFLLYVAAMFYLADVFKGAHPLFQTMGYGLVIGFFVLLGIIAIHKGEKTIDANQKLISKLKEWLADVQSD